MADQSDDTVALVAAQLTQAWAAIFTRKEGANGLSPAEIRDQVGMTYNVFLERLRAGGEGDGPAYVIVKL